MCCFVVGSCFGLKKIWFRVGVSSKGQKNVKRYSRWLHFDCEFTVLGERGAEQGTFKISTFETLTVFYRLGALGAYHGAIVGFFFIFFRGYLGFTWGYLGDSVAFLGYLRLHLGCLGSLLMYLGL